MSITRLLLSGGSIQGRFFYLDRNFMYDVTIAVLNVLEVPCSGRAFDSRPITR